MALSTRLTDTGLGVRADIGALESGTGFTDGVIAPAKTSFAVEKNLFNKATVTLGYYVNNTNGVLATNASYAASDYIPVLPNTIYTQTKGYYMAYYNAAKTFISGLGVTGAPDYGANPRTATTPALCYFMRVTVVNSPSALNVYQVEQGSSVTAYASYGLILPRLSLLPYSTTDYLQQGKNLFDKSTITTGYYVNQATGALAVGASYDSSAFIPVSAATQYSFVSSAGLRIAYYNSSNTFISGTLEPSSPVTTPALTAYVRFSFSHIDLDIQQFEQSSTNTAYESYGQKFIKAALPSTYAITPSVYLPSKIYALVGQEINIYFDNILNVNENDYDIDVTCVDGSAVSIGKQYKEFWRAAPTGAGTFNWTITLRKNDQIIYTKTVSLVISAAAVGTGASKNVLVIGDSTTANGIAVTTLLSDFGAGDPMDIVLIGTQGTTPNFHEGFTGWTAALAATNAASPFVEAGAFDFAHYLTHNSLDTPNHVIINLGINDMFGSTSDALAASVADTALGHFNTIVNGILAYATANSIVINVGVALTIPPNYLQDAFGLDYGTGQTRARYRRNNLTLVKKLIDTFGALSASHVYVVPINASVDTRYGFGNAEENANARSTTQVLRGTVGHGVHPDQAGYDQIADCYWYYIKSFET